LATPDVGGKRPNLEIPRNVDFRPAPKLPGSRQDEVLSGGQPQSGRAKGPSLLDSYKNNRNKFCGQWSVAGQVEDNGKSYRHIARLGCKGWTCRVCGPKKAKRLRQAVIQAATQREMRRFLTLTLDPRLCTADESEKYIKDCWGKFRVYLNRLNKESIDFIWFLERQKSGYAHLHILVDRYIPQPWIQKSWQAVGGGRFVNIKVVDIHRVSAYLSKYLTKELILADYRPGTRRYSTSRNIRLFERVKKGLWELIRQSIDNLGSPDGILIAEIKCDEDGVLQWFRIEIAQNA